MACGLARDEQAAWIIAWQRTQGAFGSVRVIPETDTVEAAPDATATIDVWLAQRERECRQSGRAGGSPAEAIERLVGDALSMIADGTRLIQQLPKQPQGRADPVAMAQVGASAARLFLKRIAEVPRIRGGGPAGSRPTVPEDDPVPAHIEACRQRLRARLLVMTAQWPGIALRLRLTNPGDIDIVGATVKLTLPDGVRPIDPALAGRTLPGLPPRPGPVQGSNAPTFTLNDVFNEDLRLVEMVHDAFSAQRDIPDGSIADLVIDFENRTVECEGIDIRRKESTRLPVIPLAIESVDAGTIVIGWTVAGSGPEQRFSGTIAVQVSPSTLPLDGLFHSG